MPSGTVALQPPPEVPRGGGDGHWSLNLLPMVAGLGSVVFFFVPGANALMMIVGGLTFASSLVFGAVTTVRQRNGGKGRLVEGLLFLAVLPVLMAVLGVYGEVRNLKG